MGRGAMIAKRWSLARRLAWWVLAVMVTPGIVVVVMGGVFLRSSIERELDALAQEEIEELLVRVRSGDDPLAMFPVMARELAHQHPDTPLGWRIVDRHSGEVRGEFGERELVASEPALGPDDRAPAEETAVLVDQRVKRAFDLTPELRGLLVIDGRQEFAMLTQYWRFAMALLGAGGVLALVASRLLAARVRRLVGQVAEDLRATRGEDAPPHPRVGAPDEIREVVDALGEEMRRIRAEAERVNLFTASLAHELRSPLQNLIGQVEVAMLRPRDPTTYAEILRSQLAELTELGDAVDNLVAMCARPTAVAWEREEFDLAAEARLRLQRELARAARDGVDLRIEVAGETRIRGDREGVLRAIRNVVANAIDWTPDAGRVTLRIEGREKDVVVTADDSGPGVPAEVRPRVFEPFVQGPRLQRRRAGYGLGLAIAREATLAHGGTIEVGDAPSGGARFTLTFQRVSPASAPVAAVAAPA